MSSFNFRKYIDIITEQNDRSEKKAVNESKEMTIMVGNNGTGEKFVPTKVQVKELKMDDRGQPILVFTSSSLGDQPLVAEFKNGQWVADLD